MDDLFRSLRFVSASARESFTFSGALAHAADVEAKRRAACFMIPVRHTLGERS